MEEKNNMKKFPFLLLLVALLTAPVFYGCGDDDDDDNDVADVTLACDDYDSETSCVADDACEWVDAAARAFYPTASTPVTDTTDDDDDDTIGVDGYCQEIGASDGEEEDEVALTGLACTEDSDCGAGICLTTEVLINLGLEDFPDTSEIEDGYCSMLLCANDEQCGDDGLCLDIAEFVGAEITACLLACDPADVCLTCRDSDEYRCYTREGFDTAACLPTPLILSLEADPALGVGDCDSTTWEW
jgi:hypothetical protein